MGAGDVAKEFGVTARRVQQLAEDGTLPRAGRGKYELLACALAYARYWQALAERRTAPVNPLDQRSDEIEVRLAELKLYRQEGSTVTLDYMEDRLGAYLERVRAHLLNMPGKMAPAMVGLRTIADSQERLSAAIAEIMQAMTEIGDDPELEAGDLAER